MKRHALYLLLALALATVLAELNTAKSSSALQYDIILEHPDGSYGHSVIVYVSADALVNAMNGYRLQGDKVISASSRGAVAFNWPTQDVQTNTITVAPQSAYGTQCPGYPVPPFPNAQCYPDGGWR